MWITDAYAAKIQGNPLSFMEMSFGFVEDYFLEIFAIIYFIILIAHLATPQGRSEIMHRKILLVYFIVSTIYIPLNIFTDVIVLIMPFWLANIIHSLLCFALILIKK